MPCDLRGTCRTGLGRLLLKVYFVVESTTCLMFRAQTPAFVRTNRFADERSSLELEGSLLYVHS